MSWSSQVSQGFCAEADLPPPLRDQTCSFSGNDFYVVGTMMILIRKAKLQNYFSLVKRDVGEDVFACTECFTELVFQVTLLRWQCQEHLLGKFIPA